MAAMVGAPAALAENLGSQHPFQEAHNHVIPIPEFSCPLLASVNTSHAHNPKLIHVNKTNESSCIVQLECCTAMGTIQVLWGV